MGDTLTTGNQIILDLSFSREDGSTESRKLTFDTEFANAETAKNYVIAMAIALRSKYKYAIQPSSWRDSNDDEEAYEISGVHGQFKTTTTVDYDF